MELQTTASTQNHHPAPKTAPATPGPKIDHSSAKSIGGVFLLPSSYACGSRRVDLETGYCELNE